MNEPVYKRVVPVRVDRIESESDKILYPAKNSKNKKPICVLEVISLSFPLIKKAKKVTTARNKKINSKRLLYPSVNKKVEFILEGLTGMKIANKTATPKAIARFLSAS